MTRQEWLQKTTSLFLKKGLDSPKLSAEILLCFALCIDRLQLITYPLDFIPKTAHITLTTLVKRRLKGEPIAYIVGKKEFFSRDFFVTQETLIPRPETELLIKFALDTLLTDHIYFIDAGTGSGCIAITLCAERPSWRGIALDVSRNTLKIAKKNGYQHSLNKQLIFTQGNFTSNIIATESLDLYISNPPYIGEKEYEELSHEIVSFEPKIALVPNSPPVNLVDKKNITGIEALKKIIQQAEYCLKEGGLILFEHGELQREECSMLLKNNIWRNILYHDDLSKKPRFISAYKKK